MCFYPELLFLPVESFIEITWKPIFFDFFSSLQWKQFFQLMETEFLSNGSLRPMETDFLSSVVLLRAIFVLVET